MSFLINWTTVGFCDRIIVQENFIMANRLYIISNFTYGCKQGNEEVEDWFHRRSQRLMQRVTLSLWLRRWDGRISNSRVPIDCLVIINVLNDRFGECLRPYGVIITACRDLISIFDVFY